MREVTLLCLNMETGRGVRYARIAGNKAKKVEGAQVNLGQPVIDLDTARELLEKFRTTGTLQ